MRVHTGVCELPRLVPLRLDPIFRGLVFADVCAVPVLRTEGRSLESTGDFESDGGWEPPVGWRRLRAKSRRHRLERAGLRRCRESSKTQVLGLKVGENTTNVDAV